MDQPIEPAIEPPTEVPLITEAVLEATSEPISELAAEHLDEMKGQERDVLGTITRRRDAARDHVGGGRRDLFRNATLDGLLEVPAGGRDDIHGQSRAAR